MFVKQFNNQPKIDVENFDQILNYQFINSLKLDEMRRNDLLIDCNRKITIFDHSTIIDQLETQEDYILLENRVVHHNTPFAYNMFYESIDKSFMYSVFLFVKPRSKEYEKNAELTLLYGFSTGYGEFKKPNNIKMKYLDYGFSLLDQINNFNPSKENLTYQFHKYKLFDNNVNFFGPLIPNIYTESQWEYLFKERYNYYFTKLNKTYYLKDLCDENTRVEKTRFIPMNRNDFENEMDFFTMDNFEKICFLFLFYHISSINIIYHTRNGINFDNLVKEFSFNSYKNEEEFKEMILSVLDRIKKTELFHKVTSNNLENDFLIMISANQYCYSFNLVCENTNREINIKISKAEMLEKIFSNFTLNNNLIANMINEKNREVSQRQLALGYYDDSEYEINNNKYKHNVNIAETMFTN